MIASMDTVALILLPLAVARVTRLITADRILEPVRDRLISRWIERKGGDSLAAYLITCPWCVSVYVGAAGAAGWWAWGGTRVYAAVLLAFACSYVTGWLASHEGE